MFVSQVFSSTSLNEPGAWFIFQEEEILLENLPNVCKIPVLPGIQQFNFHIKQQHYLGIYEKTHCYTAQITQTPTTLLPQGTRFQPLRQAHASLANDDLFAIAIRAKQILHWDESTQFCGHCGQKTQPSTTERAKICSICHTLVFPHLAPVILALIWREEEILLARSPSFLPNIYSILAGFVEPGETLEQTVIREVHEEVGISIKNLRYYSSQPWPFPSNLMIGFTAEYDMGDIKVNKTELEDAQWFSIHNLPPLPKPISLSRQMIDAHASLRKRDNL
ncbi:MAG: NAD(+) diphosphatase [Proteobacteria bacterium]|nr:NAD(+) diphosphatase [Pseudomonadota bacterium]